MFEIYLDLNSSFPIKSNYFFFIGNMNPLFHSSKEKGKEESNNQFSARFL